METVGDDTEEDIGTSSLRAVSALLDEPEANPTGRVQMRARDLAAYLVRPEDSSDDGRICEGSRGAYANRSFWRIIKAFLWIGVGIVASMVLAQLN